MPRVWRGCLIPIVNSPLAFGKPHLVSFGMCRAHERIASEKMNPEGFAETRRKYIPVGSAPASLLATVSQNITALARDFDRHCEDPGLDPGDAAICRRHPERSEGASQVHRCLRRSLVSLDCFALLAMTPFSRIAVGNGSYRDCFAVHDRSRVRFVPQRNDDLRV